MCAGDRVRVIANDDGESGITGTIGRVYASGRIRVDLDCGGFRNMSQQQVELIDDRNASE